MGLKVKNYKPRVPRHKQAGHLDIYDHAKQDSTPDALLEYNIVDRWDERDPYSCVTCNLPFDALVDRIPYTLPCNHNVCINCLKDALEQQRIDYECPVDNCFVTNLGEVKENRDLFSKVKSRARD